MTQKAIKHNQFRFSLMVVITIFILLSVSLPALAEEKTANPSGSSYQMPDDSDYQIENGSTVSTFKYGRRHMGNFFVKGEINSESTFNGYTAYAVGNVVTFGYSYNGGFQTDNKDAWNIHDAGSRVKGADTFKNVRTGMVIIEKSSDGTNWESATDPANDFFKSNKNGNESLYTTDAADIMNGEYYRVTVAYKMKKRISQGNIAIVIPTEEYEYIECVEIYEFYICSDRNYVSVQDLSTRQNLGNNAVTNSGFYIQKNGSTAKVIVSRDNLEGKEAEDYAYFSQPGKYKIEITTGLGKKWYYTVSVSDGLAMTSLSPKVYESKKNSGFPISEENVTGDSSLTELFIARNVGSDISTSTHNGFPAYGVNNSQSLSLYMRLKANADNAGNGWHIEYDSWGKKKKEKINDIMTGEIGKGALIVQTSKDEGKTWEDIDRGRYADGLYTTDYATYYSGNENVLIYTPSGEDILSGVYIRVLFAYQLKNSDGKDTKDYLESYEFYLCSDELNAVTFHNLSVKDQLEETMGDADETTVQMLKTAETMLSGACTTTGFSIDTSMNPTVTISVKRNGKDVQIPGSKEFTTTGRYDIHITSAVGTSRDVQIYVDRNTDADALKLYFGNGFITENSKRIFAEGEYPVYEGGKAFYNVESVNDSFVPVGGAITNTSTGKTIEISQSGTKKSGTLTEAGEYVAEFTTNPDFESDNASGDARVFTFRFKIIASGSAPGPKVNQNSLEEYSHLTMSDSYPIYYGLTYQSAGTGNITLAFATKKAAIDYAYEHEKGRVEKQKDGTYRYDGIYVTSQKILYESNWDLTDAIYYFAEQAVQKLHFDLSDEFYYLTLSSDVLEANDNLKTLELKSSIVIFADGQKDVLTDLDAVPLINDKAYSYLNPKNGKVIRGKESFKFVTDAYGGIDSNKVVITDANGQEYDISYMSSVGKQLEKENCPSGIVTISETTKYGDEAHYQALYIAPQDNKTEVTLACYDGRASKEININRDNVASRIYTDSFSIKSISDQLDPYAMVVVKNSSREFPFVVGDEPDQIWSEPGDYTIQCVNRMGYGFTQEITVEESDNAVIAFNGEGTDSLQSILTYCGAKDVQLPHPSRYGYDFVGFIDEDKQLFKDSIDTVPYRGEKILDAVWEPKQVSIYLCDENGKQINSIVGEFGKTYEIPTPEVSDGKTFIGWQKDGISLNSDDVQIDTEEDIVLTMVTEDSTEVASDEVSAKTETKAPVALIAIILVAIVGFVAWYKIEKSKEGGCR